MSIENLLSRYTAESRNTITLFLVKLAKTTRKTGKISESRKMNIVTSFEAFDPDIVISSLNAYLSMDISDSKSGKGKNERYVRGIMTNKQAEKDARAGASNGTGKGNVGTNDRKFETGTDQDEGTRLQQLAESAVGGRLECDF